MKVDRYKEIKQAVISAEIEAVERAGQDARARCDLIKKRVQNLEPDVLIGCLKTWLNDR